MTRALGGLVWAGLVALLAGLAMTVGQPGAVPLVQPDGWTERGTFPKIIDTFNPLEIPEFLSTSPGMMRWWSWTPKGGAAGSITSPPFSPPRFIAVPHHGFPGDTPRSRVVLRCVTSGAELQISRLRTNIQWATTFLEVPRTFCAGDVVVEASADRPQFIVGVGTPFAVSSAVYHAHAAFPARALVVVSTWAALVLVLLAVAVWLGAHTGADPLPAAFVVLGAVAMGVFTVFHFSPPAGRTTVWLTIAGAAAVTGAARARMPDVLGAVWAEVRVPLFVWLGVAIVCSAFVASADSGGGSWAVNGLFSPLRWSTDNQIPADFAEALYRNTPRETIAWGPWLASDRTPLLAALLLVPRTLVLAPLGAAYGTTFIALGYTAAGITVLASWAAAVAWVCQRWARRATATVVWLVAATAFVFFDTVYIWPKLLGATFVLLAFTCLFEMARAGRGPAARLVTVAGCAVLAYLSHASNAFALVPVAVMFVPVIWRQGLPAIAVATASGAALMLPWSLWQWFVQPGGNALLRQALANQDGFTNRASPMLPSIVAAYQTLGLDGWWNAKVAALKFITGISPEPGRLGNVARYSPGTDVLGYLRVLDFFVLIRSIGVALAGLIVLPFLRRGPLANDAGAFAAKAAVAGIAGVLFSLVVTLPIAYMHHQPFGSLLLLTVAGAMTLAGCGTAVARLALALALGYFAVVWLWHPLAIAERVQWTALAGLAYGVLLVQGATATGRPEAVAERV